MLELMPEDCHTHVRDAPAAQEDYGAKELRNKISIVPVLLEQRLYIP